jgi:hypothetical protein
MQVTARSYLMAGLAAAGMGALAIAPMPSLEGAMPADVQVRNVQNTALVDDLVGAYEFGVLNAGILNNGALGSATVANGVGTGFLAQLPLLPVSVAAQPTQTPTILNAGVTGLVSAATGVAPFGEPVAALGPTSTPVDGAPGVPGGYTNATVDPPGPLPLGTYPVPVSVPNSANIPKPFNSAVNTVENNLIAAGVPGAKVLKSTTVESQRVGTAVVQAQGLVRTATVGAVQGTINAATTGGNVPGAVQTGLNNVGKSVFGDPSVTQKVNPTTGQPDNTSAGVDSVRKLGAIGTVSSATQTAAKNVANSVTSP